MADTETHASSQPRQTITAWLRTVTTGPVNTVAGILVKLGLTPNLITILGLLISAAAAFLAAKGQFAVAGGVLLVGSIFDAFDGAVARLTGTVSRFGALLDSTLDRYGEGLLFLGLMYFYGTTGKITPLVLVGVTIIGSIMVSYVRARSEGLGLENKVGLLTRVERVIVLVAALLVNQVIIGLWVLAIGTHITVLQRVVEAARQAKLSGETRDEYGE